MIFISSPLYKFPYFPASLLDSNKLPISHINRAICSNGHVLIRLTRVAGSHTRDQFRIDRQFRSTQTV